MKDKLLRKFIVYTVVYFVFGLPYKCLFQTGRMLL